MVRRNRHASPKKSVLQCSLCGRCRIDCNVDIDSPEMWRKLRGRLAAEGWGLESLDTLSQAEMQRLWENAKQALDPPQSPPAPSSRQRS